LEQRGLTQPQAKGVAAGIVAESGGDPENVNPRSGAYGIGQWLGKRKELLFKWYGPHPTLAQQLTFLAWELHGGDSGGQQVLRQRTASGALRSYVTDFMRPKPGAETEGDLSRGGAALAAMATAPAIASQAGAADASRTVNVDVHEVNIHTKATDADGMARDAGPALSRELAVQANRGMF
jgi:hypothetical protein